MSSLISALLFLWLATAWYSVAVITLALALVVVKLDALGVAQISDSLKGPLDDPVGPRNQLLKPQKAG